MELILSLVKTTPDKSVIVPLNDLFFKIYDSISFNPIKLAGLSNAYDLTVGLRGNVILHKA